MSHHSIDTFITGIPSYVNLITFGELSFIKVLGEAFFLMFSSIVQFVVSIVCLTSIVTCSKLVVLTNCTNGKIV